MHSAVANFIVVVDTSERVIAAHGASDDVFTRRTPRRSQKYQDTEYHQVHESTHKRSSKFHLQQMISQMR